MCIDTYWYWSVWYRYIIYIYIIYPHVLWCFTVFPSCSDLSPGNAACTSLADLQSWSWQEIWSLPDPQLAIRSRSAAICCSGSTKTGKTGTTWLGRSLPSIPVDPSCQVLHRVAAVSTSFSHPGSWEFEQKHRKNNGTRIIWPIFLIISPTLVLLTPFLGVFNIFRSVWQPQNCQVFGTVQDGAPPVSGAPKKTCRHFLSRVKKNRNASLYDYGWYMDG